LCAEARRQRQRAGYFRRCFGYHSPALTALNLGIVGRSLDDL
jgi:hypothetical protein